MKGFVGELVKMVVGSVNGKGNSRTVMVTQLEKKVHKTFASPAKTREKAVAVLGSEISPEQVILMDEADFKDL